ncbi:DUF935 domain-containing protein [Acinetobacter bereziniae]|uniref:DUF935 domain-containing protein n=1 Tax=Acinetobacter bereziniae TaxID=106648 RepID=A0A8I1DFC6_ACIBZ|nr:DUF935 domain-containing protein [Acinetobacter bereziniae]QQC83006.1 DUF935 domain-containing protein [Acinetobacter bereziniae]UUN96155.1 DUF935 domain-containing protein [Acinetobacter bereziniae]
MAKKKINSEKADLTALETTQTAEVAWLSNQWQEHPVVGMTPQRMHQLLTNAEQGNLQAQADLFADMEERDGHIFSEMDKRKKGVNGLAWSVVPPRNANDVERKIAAEVQEWLDDIKDFEMFLFDALDAVGHGYSAQEIIWHRLGNIWIPKSFNHVSPRHFLTPYNQPNVLRLNDGSPEGVDFLDFGWVVHRHKAKSGYIARSGLHRVLTWSFLFKNYGIRDVMEFLETYGLPNKIGKYPSGATSEEKMTLLRAVMMIGRNAGGIIPNGMSIDFQAATDGETKNHFDLVNWCEKTQSKVIVGGTLLSQSDGKSSTNALGNIHEITFSKIVKSDAKQVARSISDSLISYLMRLNYPQISPDRYPSFLFDTSDTEDLTTFSEALPKLVDIGLKIPRSWAQEKLGIPEPADDNEPILAVAQASTAAINSFLYSGMGVPNLAALSQLPTTANPAELTAIRAQMLLDQQMIQQLSNAKLQQQSEQILPELIAKLSSGKDIDEALTMLAEVFPDQDLETLQNSLEKLIFASDVLGRLSINESRKSANKED